MIKNLSPALKRHIEMNIDDIEKGNLTNSIIYCPLDIMSDYLDTLRMIDEVIPGHLIPFTRISCYLASVLKGGHMYNITIRGIGDETYEFKFPFSNIDYVQMRKELTDCCPHHYVTVDIGVDYNNGLVSIKVSIQNILTVMF